jgi:phage gp36-like protein
MSTFVSLSDYDASIHREILDAITREDPTIIEVCQQRAIAEMRSYLCKRYDCDALFAASGDDRNQLVLMMLLDIAIYHLFCIHNPQKLSQIRRDRYDRAVEWLRAVAAERISIADAPLLPQDVRAAGSQFLLRGNGRRVSHM